MIDIGSPLIFMYIMGMYVASQLSVDRSRPAVQWTFRAISLLMLGYCLAYLAFGLRLRVAAPAWANWLIAAALGAMLIVTLFFYVRADARQLRAKKAARQ